MEIAALRKEFVRAFRRAPTGAVQAPGRVNLIGEHTDYNDGFVLPMAIERRTVALWARRKDRVVRFRSLQQDEPARATLDLGKLRPGPPPWANYCKGVAAGCLRVLPDLPGADVLLDSDVPLGGGLSSSAALEVATALALLAAAGQAGAVPPEELARLCRQAEHDFAGAPCGIMDQTVALRGQAGHALLLDCRDLSVRQIPFDDPGVTVLVADTQVRHALSDGGYAARRAQCHAAARKLGLPALRDADLTMLARADGDGLLEEKELMRARHVVGEIQRTLDAADALGAGDCERFGQLMYRSHESLRNDYEVSCPELDAIVEQAGRCEGVYGARMTGGGFGGCAIVLARTDRAAGVMEAVQKGFQVAFGRRCPVFATRAAGGAGALE